MKLAVIFVGQLHDRGFNAAALIGANRVAERRDADVEIVDGVAYDPAQMERALRDAAGRSDGVIFIGGQGNLVSPVVAGETPDKAFAVVQGDVSGPNLASYDVLQEQSAFLAGCLAARLTRSGIIGHLSGHRVKPGLKGRAAFIAGARHIDPEISILTGFCGTQDDSATTRAWANAQIAAGADILFTMLNGARQGAIDACRAAGTRQIGNALDWCVIEPDVFAASAVARIDLAVERAAADMIDGLRPSRVEHLGLAEGDMVDLTLAEDVDATIAADMARLRNEVAQGDIRIATDYDGPEFSL
ncbi:BMP family protein [Jannaschia pohangensis]|uniref:Nucleoside-binding protein n=1 Tax=Jannaschia pohangensis TaxID=390807 RepID=A0A1I3GWY8_9RHOB|nr:BMP family protein [Jannaschia pohangensis]SFI27974.1 nucleoside-binding protein [Jannaschia pohangensis]